MTQDIAEQPYTMPTELEKYNGLVAIERRLGDVAGLRILSDAHSRYMEILENNPLWIKPVAKLMGAEVPDAA